MRFVHAAPLKPHSILPFDININYSQLIFLFWRFNNRAGRTQHTKKALLFKLTSYSMVMQSKLGAHTAQSSPEPLILPWPWFQSSWWPERSAFLKKNDHDLRLNEIVHASTVHALSHSCSIKLLIKYVGCFARRHVTVIWTSVSYNRPSHDKHLWNA